MLNYEAQVSVLGFVAGSTGVVLIWLAIVHHITARVQHIVNVPENTFSNF